MSASVNKVKMGIVLFAVAAAVGVSLATPQLPQKDVGVHVRLPASKTAHNTEAVTTLSGNVEFRLESLG